MSKIKETVTRPASTDEEVVRLKCDLCGRESETWAYWKAPDNEHAGNKQFVEIAYEYGTSYPEGGSGMKESFDVCPVCWMDKVVPWFKSQGAEISVKDWDF